MKTKIYNTGNAPNEVVDSLRNATDNGMRIQGTVSDPKGYSYDVNTTEVRAHGPLGFLKEDRVDVEITYSGKK